MYVLFNIVAYNRYKYIYIYCILGYSYIYIYRKDRKIRKKFNKIKIQQKLYLKIF